MEINKGAFAAIVGRPNVGKSTLINRLVGQKVSIVSPKPQTTRGAILGIMNEGDAQISFIDTPGMHTAQSRLGSEMLRAVSSALSDVDIALMVVEPVANAGAPERAIIEKLKQAHCPAILVINKLDTAKKSQLLGVIDTYSKLFDFDAIIPISAVSGDGISELKKEIISYAVEGEGFYPEEQFTDQSERELVAEIIREKALLLLDKEIPHGLAVNIITFKKKPGAFVIDADLYCEKASHKGIIIGKQGAMLKELSTRARRDIERLLDDKVYLKIWVKVRESWRDSDFQLKTLGLSKEDK